MSETTEPDQLTKVAQDLTAIENMTAQLLTEAVHRAGDSLMPGGHAMVALADVASPETWLRRVEVTEAAWWNDDDAGHDERPDWLGSDEDDTWEPPLQTLLFWSEQWRDHHGYGLDARPTIASEANFVRWCLNWAWDNEPHFADFATDIRQARRRLEDVLYAGIRVERGVPCLYDECKGRRLTRKILDDGRRTDWRCASCKRTWDEDRYASMVTAANEAAKCEYIGDETWCSVDYASREVGRSVKTIRTWINDGKVATACLIAGRRTKFVNLDDVRQQDELAQRRARKTA